MKLQPKIMHYWLIGVVVISSFFVHASVPVSVQKLPRNMNESEISVEADQRKDLVRGSIESVLKSIEAMQRTIKQIPLNNNTRPEKTRLNKVLLEKLDIAQGFKGELESQFTLISRAGSANKPTLIELRKALGTIRSIQTSFSELIVKDFPVIVRQITETAIQLGAQIEPQASAQAVSPAAAAAAAAAAAVSPAPATPAAIEKAGKELERLAEEFARQVQAALAPDMTDPKRRDMTVAAAINAGFSVSAQERQAYVDNGTPCAAIQAYINRVSADLNAALARLAELLRQQ